MRLLVRPERGQAAARRQGGAPCGRYTARMIPVSDVIPSRSPPVMTIALVLINALAFGYGLGLGASPYGTVPAAGGGGGWTAVLMSMFLHAGWLPAGASMLCLWVFGDNVEGAMGRLPFLLFYLAAGALGALAQAAATPGAMAPLPAASAPVAAVMAAYFVLYPRSKVLMVVFLILYVDVIEVPAIFLLGFWLLVHVLTGAAAIGTGVPSGAAFGPALAGFAAGALAGLAVRRQVKWE